MKTEIISIRDALQEGLIEKDQDQTLEDFENSFFEGDPDYIQTLFYSEFFMVIQKNDINYIIVQSESEFPEILHDFAKTLEISSTSIYKVLTQTDKKWKSIDTSEIMSKEILWYRGGYGYVYNVYDLTGRI